MEAINWRGCLPTIDVGLEPQLLQYPIFDRLRATGNESIGGVVNAEKSDN